MRKVRKSTRAREIDEGKEKKGDKGEHNLHISSLQPNLDRFGKADIHEHGAIEFDARHQIHDVNLKF